MTESSVGYGIHMAEAEKKQKQSLVMRNMRETCVLKGLKSLVRHMRPVVIKSKRKQKNVRLCGKRLLTVGFSAALCPGTSP